MKWDRWVYVRACVQFIIYQLCTHRCSASGARHPTPPHTHTTSSRQPSAALKSLIVGVIRLPSPVISIVNQKSRAGPRQSHVAGLKARQADEDDAGPYKDGVGGPHFVSPLIADGRETSKNKLWSDRTLAGKRSQGQFCRLLFVMPNVRACVQSPTVNTTKK